MAMRQLSTRRSGVHGPRPRCHSQRHRRCLCVITVLVLTLLAGYGAQAQAYSDKTTHGQLTENSINLAAAGAPADPYRELRLYRTVIKQGAVAEDEQSRPYNHFYDPSTNLGLPRNSYSEFYARIQGEGAQEGATELPRFISALDWARDHMPDKRDWKGAIEAYDYTDASKMRAYEALGHVVHLLQDMGQPDHVRDRPHPCNYARAKLGLLIHDLLAYEKLWELQTRWPAGSAARKPATLEAAFTDLAWESRKAEDALQLPWPDELALGCGPGRIWTLFPGGTVLVRAIRTHGWTFLEDHHWVKYELGLPLQPTIPPPPGDLRTQAYLNLGHLLLPKVEEYGAGLLQLFHDIVNHPPFVASVQILQEHDKDVVKYHARWEDQTAEGRVTARTLVKEKDTALVPGLEATVIIKFGPWLLHGDNEQHEPVGDVKVWIEPPNSRGSLDGPAAGAREIIGSFRKAAGGQKYFVWEGRFIPDVPGTISIQAKDLHEHFEGAPPHRRQHKGDVLDSNPATPARVTWPHPFEWQGYEPGPDRNHRFTVKLGECLPSKIAEDFFKGRPWGTWNGTITVRRVYKVRKTYDLSVLLGTGSEEWQLDLSFESRVRVHPQPSGTRIEGTGRSNGQYRVTIREAKETPYGNRDSSLKVDTYDFSGPFQPDVDGPGLSRDGTYEIRFRYASVEHSRSSYLPHRVGGTACADGSLQGSIMEKPCEGGEDCVETLATWSFTYTPGDAPPHEVVRDSGPNFHNHQFSRYSEQVALALRPLVLELFMRGKHVDANSLQEWDHSARDYDRHEGQKIWSERIKAYGMADRLWKNNAPDSEYSEALRKLQDAVSRFNKWKRGIEERYAVATEQAAARAEQVDSAVAITLRNLVERLRRDGIQSFGVTTPQLQK